MKRPSNPIIGFILAVAGIFLAYGVGRLLIRAIRPPEVELEEDYDDESQLNIPQDILIGSSFKIASPVNSNKLTKE